eukprot:15318490-Ditylum_brightwellii.AAC.1
MSLAFCQLSGFQLFQQDDWLEFLRAVTLRFIGRDGLGEGNHFHNSFLVASHALCGVISLCTALEVAHQCRIKRSHPFFIDLKGQGVIAIFITLLEEVVLV